MIEVTAIAPSGEIIILKDMVSVARLIAFWRDHGYTVTSPKENFIEASG